MRPKKVILLVDANEIELSIRAYMLWNAGYSVLRVSSAIDALQVLCCAAEIDALVSSLDIVQMDGTELARRGKEICPGLPCLIFSRVVTGSKPIDTEHFLPKEANNAEMVLEKIKLLVARKRGPKPQKASEYAQ